MSAGAAGAGPTGPDPAGSRPPTRPSARFILIAGLAALAAFLVGFGWQFVEARSARTERDALQTELVFQELATTLASAAIQAEYGSFEGARELMSRFFSGLQTHLDEAPAEARSDLAGILERRDAVITRLSRSEEGSRSTLARLFVQYQTAFGRQDRALPLPMPRDTGPSPDTGGAAADTSGGPFGTDGTRL